MLLPALLIAAAQASALALVLRLLVRIAVRVVMVMVRVVLVAGQTEESHVEVEKQTLVHGPRRLYNRKRPWGHLDHAQAKHQSETAESQYHDQCAPRVRNRLEIIVDKPGVQGGHERMERVAHD